MRTGEMAALKIQGSPDSERHICVVTAFLNQGPEGQPAGEKGPRETLLELCIH